jgi:hypothetical protein
LKTTGTFRSPPQPLLLQTQSCLADGVKPFYRARSFSVKFAFANNGSALEMKRALASVRQHGL